MRVVLLNQYYLPAEAPTATLAADLCAALVAAGHEVHVVASSRSYNDPARRYRRRETIDGVQVRRTPTSGFGRAGKLGRVLDYATFLAGAFVTLLRVPRPDVAVAMTTPPLLAWFVGPAVRLRRARLVCWVMDVYPELAFELGVLSSRGIAGRFLRRAASGTLRRADSVVSLGRHMSARLTAAGARDATAIDNWCDGEAIRPRPVAGHGLRAELGWEGRLVVLYSGNMGLAHEFETLLDAAAELSARRELRFAFVGGGARLAEIREGAARRGLANVEFHPWIERDRLADGLTAGDVHVVSLRNALSGLLVPSKIYGILAAGRPCLYIGPADSEVAEILDAAGCGVRVDVGDAGSLARAIAAYANDPALRARHGKAARAAFDRAYDRALSTSRLVALLEAVGGESRR